MTILVNDTTPETYCQFHSGMGGNLNVDLGETVTFSVDGADKDLVNIDGSTVRLGWSAQQTMRSRMPTTLMLLLQTALA